MNIVKFRDIILDESNNKNNLSEDKVLFFNEKLKGKYAYAVNFRHIIPFEDITCEFARPKFLTLPVFIFKRPALYGALSNGYHKP